MNLLNEVKLKFRTGDVTTRLVIVNFGVFALSLLLDITFTLFSIGPDRLAYTALNYPWNPVMLAHKPWAPVTALFSSWGLWNLLFNMLVLYWLGGVFLKFFTSNALRGLYVLGGMTGMLLFTGIFMAFPSLQQRGWTDSIPLCSVCILAFCTALAFRAPDATEQIPLIGAVSLKYIVITLAIIDVALLPNVNPATDAAHLGAAFTGWAFNYMLGRGKDLTSPVTTVAVWLDKIIHRKKGS